MPTCLTVSVFVRQNKRSSHALISSIACPRASPRPCSLHTFAALSALLSWPISLSLSALASAIVVCPAQQTSFAHTQKKIMKYESNLSDESATRLSQLLSTPIWIHSSNAMACGMPRFELVPCVLIHSLATQLRRAGVVVEDISLEGSAAAAFVCPELNTEFVSKFSFGLF